MACSTSGLTRFAVRAASSRQAIDQPLGSVGRVITPDFVKLLPRVAHDLAGPADVVDFLGQL